MRKKLLLLAVALLGMASAQAQEVSVANFEVLKGGSNTLTVTVAGNVVRDAQFDITVPTGVTLAAPTVPEGSKYAVEASAVTATDAGNKYTVILYSADAETGGETISFVATADNSFTEYWKPEITVSTMSDAKYTVAAATETAFTSIPTYTFEVGLLGDVDKTGVVDSDDAQAIIQYYLGKNPSPFAVVAANVDEGTDGTIDSDDAQKAIQIYLGN